MHDSSRFAHSKWKLAEQAQIHLQPSPTAREHLGHASAPGAASPPPMREPHLGQISASAEHDTWKTCLHAHRIMKSPFDTASMQTLHR
jgi:hypothetical protein